MTLTTTQPVRAITIGVDTHSLVHHAAVLDSLGHLLGNRRFSTICHRVSGSFGLGIQLRHHQRFRS